MMQKLDNLTLFLLSLPHFGIEISGISAEDLFNDHEELALVVLVALVKRFEILLIKVDVFFRHFALQEQ